MTKEETIKYFIEKKQKGASYGELANLFKLKNISDNDRREIMKHITKVEQEQKEKDEIQQSKNIFLTGIINIIIGIFILGFAYALHIATVSKGIIFGLNILAWGAGVVYMCKGLYCLLFPSKI